jgi:uncharacterized membrane protein YedE/YeeE
MEDGILGKQVGEQSQKPAAEIEALVEDTMRKIRVASGVLLVVGVSGIFSRGLLDLAPEYQMVFNTIARGWLGLGAIGMFQTFLFDTFHEDADSQIAIANAAMDIAILLVSALSVVVLAGLDILQGTVDSGLPTSPSWLPGIIAGSLLLSLTAPYLSVYVTTAFGES